MPSRSFPSVVPLTTGTTPHVLKSLGCRQLLFHEDHSSCFAEPHPQHLTFLQKPSFLAPHFPTETLFPRASPSAVNNNVRES